MNYWYLLIPILSAFIGWISIRIVLKMLFHPRKPVKISGLTLQGVFPKRQAAFAEKIGRIINDEFFSSGFIEQKIADPDTAKKLIPVIETHVDDFLRNRLSREMPMISMFIGDKTIDKLKAALLKEIELLFPTVMLQYAANLKSELDPGQQLTKKIASFPAEKLEEFLTKGLRKEIRLAALAGALIGFIIGLLQLVILLL